jgi:hypothetical protein
MCTHEFEVRFTLKSIPQIKDEFEGAVKVDDFEIETQEGKIFGKSSISIDSNDPVLAERLAIKKIEELVSIFTLAFQTAYKIDDISVVHKPIIEKTESGQIVVSVFDKARITDEVKVTKKTPKETVEKQYYFWKDRLSRLDKEKRDILLRVLRWWRKGSFDDDSVDKFLHYFIALEMFALLLTGKDEISKNEFEEVCKYIGVTFRLNNEYDIKWIRNKLMHAKREEKEKAEELAEKYASRLGDEIIQAIKKIIEESGLTT